MVVILAVGVLIFFFLALLVLLLLILLLLSFLGKSFSLLLSLKLFSLRISLGFQFSFLGGLFSLDSALLFLLLGLLSHDDLDILVFLTLRPGSGWQLDFNALLLVVEVKFDEGRESSQEESGHELLDQTLELSRLGINQIFETHSEVKEELFELPGH